MFSELDEAREISVSKAMFCMVSLALNQTPSIRFPNLVSLTRTPRFVGQTLGLVYSRCDHKMTDIFCVLYNSWARAMITLRCWVGKEITVTDRLGDAWVWLKQR